MDISSLHGTHLPFQSHVCVQDRGHCLQLFPSPHAVHHPDLWMSHWLCSWWAKYTFLFWSWSLIPRPTDSGMGIRLVIITADEVVPRPCLAPVFDPLQHGGRRPGTLVMCDSVRKIEGRQYGWWCPIVVTLISTNWCYLSNATALNPWRFLSGMCIGPR